MRNPALRAPGRLGGHRRPRPRLRPPAALASLLLFAFWIPLLAFGIPLAAQEGQGAPADAPVTSPADDPLTVWLFTAGPGDAVWERFGHNGLRIHDARTGEDLVWEWGIFDFDQVGFWGRLARGTMRYSMAARDYAAMRDWYASAGREVRLQELALTPAQEVELRDRIEANAAPQNRDYIYDYYTDNCSTRVRDHLDAVLGGAIGAATRGVPTGRSWRDHTLRLLRPSPPAWAGIQYVLGRPGDREIDAWEEMFLPIRMSDRFSGLTIQGPDGPRPLVVDDRLVAEATAFRVTETRPTWWPIAAGIGGLLALVVVGLARRAGPTAVRRRILGGLLIGWGALVGGLGTVLLAAWFFTDHDFWRWNENLLVSSPLVLGWIPIGWALLRGRPLGRRGGQLVWVLGALATTALLLQFVPGGQETLSAVLVLGSVPLAVVLGARRGVAGAVRS